MQGLQWRAKLPLWDFFFLLCHDLRDGVTFLFVLHLTPYKRVNIRKRFPKTFTCIIVIILMKSLILDNIWGFLISFSPPHISRKDNIIPALCFFSFLYSSVLFFCFVLSSRKLWKHKNISGLCQASFRKFKVWKCMHHKHKSTPGACKDCEHFTELPLSVQFPGQDTRLLRFAFLFTVIFLILNQELSDKRHWVSLTAFWSKICSGNLHVSKNKAVCHNKCAWWIQAGFLWLKQRRCHEELYCIYYI